MNLRDDSRIVEVADYYGFNAQSRQLIEEMAELTVAINKFWRNVLKCGKVEFTAEEALRKEAFASREMMNMASEIADVEVCLAQIRYMLNLDALINADANMKLNRQIGRIMMEKMEEQ